MTSDELLAYCLAKPGAWQDDLNVTYRRSD